MQSIEFLQRDRATISEVVSPYTGRKWVSVKGQLRCLHLHPHKLRRKPYLNELMKIAKHYQSLYRLNFPKVRLETLLNLSADGESTQTTQRLYLCLTEGPS